MLRSTFCHLEKVGQTKERRLWAAGVHSWNDVLRSTNLRVSKAFVKQARPALEESERRLRMGDAAYFSDRLPVREHWRLFHEFRHSTAYMDIETTGMGKPDDYITTITLYDGRSIRAYIHDQNLFDFREDIRDYHLVVTYNGKCFDVPWLERFFGMRFHQAHIDLRYVLASLGLRGGLKGCEGQLGIDRGELAGVDGFFAVLLWQDFIGRDNRSALETLLAYNAQDTVNLERLMVYAYNRKVECTPFAHLYRIPEPQPPSIPFSPDVATIRLLKRFFGASGF